ncbi:MAG: hypothetical protein GWN13_26475 [Phycisphaerae bacterium]|nr:hypothetical protein [Phycisphaerae bacterium]
MKGDVELIAEHRRDKQGIPENRRRAESLVFEERLNLKTKGDLYHPNFLLFDAALGLGLAQQRFTIDGDVDSTSTFLNEYNFYGQLLPQKPYPLTGYLNRAEGLIPRQFLGSLQTETDNAGLIFRIRDKNWPMTFEWDKSETRQDSLGSFASDFFNRDSEKLGYSLTHNFSERSRLNFRFDWDDISQRSLTASTDIDQKRYKISHDWIFGSDQQHQLNSYASSLNQSGSFDLDIFEWAERLKIQHTPDFLTNYNLRWVDTDQRNFTNRELRGQAGFEHKLYESLITTGNIFAASSDLGNQGELDQKGGSLGFNYTKRNPWGTLSSSYITSYVREDHTGSEEVGVVIDESHVFIDPLPITLERVNIDTSTIVVTDITGFDVYTLGDDYTITEVNGRVRLYVTTLGIIPPNVSDGQTLLVDYNFLTSPKREDRTQRQLFSLRQRFDNGLSVYYGHERQDESIRSDTPIAPDEFRIDTYGIEYADKGFHLLAEYSEESSTQLPSTSKRLDARHNWRIDSDTTADVHAGYHWIDFGQPDPRELELFTLGAEIFTRLRDKCTLSCRLDWRNEEDSVFGNTDGLRIGSELRYDYRQLDIRAGLEFNQLDRRDDETESTLFYIRLKRSF